MSLDAGGLNRRITIQSNVGTQDPNTGEIIPGAWTDWASNIAASVSPVSARELAQSQQTTSELRTRFVIRYRPGVISAMRVVYRGVNYDIQGVIPDPDSNLEWLTLDCSSGVNNG